MALSSSSPHSATETIAGTGTLPSLLCAEQMDRWDARNLKLKLKLKGRGEGMEEAILLLPHLCVLLRDGHG